jgi:hypothetical protein
MDPNSKKNEMNSNSGSSDDAILPPLVVSSSNPQSGDCANNGKSNHDKTTQDVIELLESSSDEDMEPTETDNDARQSLGSTAEEPITLLLDNDASNNDPAPKKKNRNRRSSVGSTSEDAIKLSSGDDDGTGSDSARGSSSLKKPFRMPEWSPRTTKQAQPPLHHDVSASRKTTTPKPTTTTSPGRSRCQPYDSSDDEQCQAAPPRGNINPPNSKGTPNKKADVIYIDSSNSSNSSSSEDEEDTSEKRKGPISTMGPRRLGPRISSPRKAAQTIIIESDSSDDNGIPPAAFSPSPRRKLTARKSVLIPARRRSENNDSDAKKPDTNANNLKAPPVYPSVPPTTEPKPIPPTASRQTSPSKIVPSTVTVPNKRTTTRRDNVPVLAASAGGGGAARGSHLAPIYKSALAAQKPVQVRDLYLQSSKERIILRTKAERQHREPEPVDKGSSRRFERRPYSSESSGNCQWKQPRPKSLDPNLKAGSSSSSIIGPVVLSIRSDRQRDDNAPVVMVTTKPPSKKEEILEKHDENFSGGIDPPIRIPSSNCDISDFFLMTTITQLSTTSTNQKSGLPTNKLTVCGAPDGKLVSGTEELLWMGVYLLFLTGCLLTTSVDMDTYQISSTILN